MAAAITGNDQIVITSRCNMSYAWPYPVIPNFVHPPSLLLCNSP
jgi:hypothetical protein